VKGQNASDGRGHRVHHSHLLAGYVGTLLVSLQEEIITCLVICIGPLHVALCWIAIASLTSVTLNAGGPSFTVSNISDNIRLEAKCFMKQSSFTDK
jgi:hypothetical protein